MNSATPIQSKCHCLSQSCSKHSSQNQFLNIDVDKAYKQKSKKLQPKTQAQWDRIKSIQKFKQYRNERRRILEIVPKLKRTSKSQAGFSKCENLIYSLERPKWFHKLSLEQIGYIEFFSRAIRDDLDENKPGKTFLFFVKMGMCPIPNDNILLKALHRSDYNAIKFLEALIEITEVKGYEEPQRGGYTWNCRLMMSCISYLEMPVLLRWLYARLPPLPEEIRYDILPIPESEKAGRKSGSVSPYLMPVWVDVKNWTELKQVRNENRKRESINIKRIQIPPIIFHYRPYLVNFGWIHDYEMKLPHVEPKKKFEKIEEEAEIPKPKKVCLFIGKMIDLVPEEGLDRLSMNNEAEHENSETSDVKDINVSEPDEEDEFIQTYNNSFKMKFHEGKIKTMFDNYNLSISEDIDRNYFPEGKYQEPIYDGDIPKLLKKTFEEFAVFGLACVKFPKIEKHPDIIQLIKFLHREGVTQQKKNAMLPDIDALNRCLSTVPMDIRFPIMEAAKALEANGKLDYTKAKKFRKLGQQHQKQFFINCWNDRYKNAQDFWISLQPIYFSSTRILQLFYDYLPSGFNAINFWPNNLRKT